MVHPYLLHPRTSKKVPLGFAHRGGASGNPENTERAFRHAVELGYTHLETDVHATSDGQLIAFHDDRLERVTDRDGAILDLPWSEVRRARVGGTDEIMTLADLFEAFPDTRINLDPKAESTVEPLGRLIRAAGVVDRVCVTAFSRRRTERVKALVGPELCTGGGYSASLKTLAAGFRIPASVRGVDVLQVPVTVGPLTVVTDRFVDAAHRLGLHVHVWTIDDPAEMERLLDMGVDGIMTDEVLELRQVYERRGIWV